MHPLKKAIVKTRKQKGALYVGKKEWKRAQGNALVKTLIKPMQ